MSVSFNGTSSRLLGASMPGASGDTSKAVSLWLYANNISARRFPFLMGASVAFQRMDIDAFNPSSGGNHYAIYTSVEATGATTIASGAWYHIFLQYVSSMTSCAMYVGGLKEASLTGQALTFGSTVLGIGGNAGGSLWWDGLIAEVAMWDGDLTGGLQTSTNLTLALAAGKSPRRVARTLLKFYAPLLKGTNINDLKGALGFPTTDNLTSANHPRIYA